MLRRNFVILEFKFEKTEMAFLLGTESCIDSLRSDLSDIQETINDIISRIGFVK